MDCNVKPFDIVFSNKHNNMVLLGHRYRQDIKPLF